MELYLIRHGQSTNNALSDQSPRVSDPPLTELGHRQAEQLAAYFADGRNRDPWVDHTTGYSRPESGDTFGIDELFCSPMFRAMQTTAPLARALGLKAQVWVDIHEHGGIYLDQPDGTIVGYPGRTRAQIAEEFPDYVIGEGITDAGWWDPRKGHESFAGAYGRAAAVAQELRRRAGDETQRGRRIALVSHGTFIDALLKGFFNQLPSRQMYYLHYNTGFTRLDFLDKERLLIRFFNRTAHLPPALVS